MGRIPHRAETLPTVIGTQTWGWRGNVLSLHSCGFCWIIPDDSGIDQYLSEEIKNYHGISVDYFLNKLGFAGYTHSRMGMRKVL